MPSADNVLNFVGMLTTTLARHKSKPRIYIGCMKSGPVLSHKYVLSTLSLSLSLIIYPRDKHNECLVYYYIINDFV